MADSSGGIIAAHKLLGKRQSGSSILHWGIMGTIAIYFINMGVDFPWIYYSGWNQCSKYFDNGNPWNSGHCDAVRAKHL